MLGDAVRVYLAGAGSAVLFCLHGGGYCGLTWALVAAALKSECGPSLASAPRIWQLWEGTGYKCQAGFVLARMLEWSWHACECSHAYYSFCMPFCIALPQGIRKGRVSAAHAWSTHSCAATGGHALYKAGAP